MGNRDKLEGPILYDSLDRPNSPKVNPNQSKPQNTQYGIALIITLALFVAAIVTYGLIWLNNIAYYSTGATILLWLISGGVAVSIVAMLIVLLLWLLLRALKDATISLDDGVPVSVLGVWLQSLNTQHAANKYYDVMQTRAQHSDYQGVSTLTLDKSVDTSTTTVAPVNESTEPTIDPVAPNKNALEDLRDKGHIGRSNNSIMIGYGNDQE